MPKKVILRNSCLLTRHVANNRNWVVWWWRNKALERCVVWGLLFASLWNKVHAKVISKTSPCWQHCSLKVIMTVCVPCLSYWSIIIRWENSDYLVFMQITPPPQPQHHHHNSNLKSQWQWNYYANIRAETWTINKAHGCKRVRLLSKSQKWNPSFFHRKQKKMSLSFSINATHTHTLGYQSSLTTSPLTYSVRVLSELQARQDGTVHHLFRGERHV